MAGVRGAVSIPLAVKIGPFFSSMANMAKKLFVAGADGLVLFNRFLQPDIDLETLTVEPRLVLSSSDELRLPLRWIAILRSYFDQSLAATSGVHTPDDVVKLLLAGADVAMTTSALLKHGPGLISDLLVGLANLARGEGVRLDRADERLDEPAEQPRPRRLRAGELRQDDPVVFVANGLVNGILSLRVGQPFSDKPEAPAKAIPGLRWRFRLVVLSPSSWTSSLDLRAGLMNEPRFRTANMRRVPITDLDDPRIAVYRSLKATNQTRGLDQFVVEGEKLVRRLAASRFPVVSILATDRYDSSVLEASLPADVPVYIVPFELDPRDRRVSVSPGRARAAVGECPGRLAGKSSGSPARRSTLVVCPRISNPENLGAIARIGDVFGVDAILAGPSCPDPLSRRVLRVSMGSVLRMPVSSRSGWTRWRRSWPPT